MFNVHTAQQIRDIDPKMFHRFDEEKHNLSFPNNIEYILIGDICRKEEILLFGSKTFKQAGYWGMEIEINSYPGYRMNSDKFALVVGKKDQTNVE